MRKKLLNLVGFLFSAVSLYISCRLFVNMAIFCDKHNSSPALICGGDFWLKMDWLRLLLLFVITLIFFVRLVKPSKKQETQT